MKQLTIIGMGMGPSTLTQEARLALQEAEVIFGAPRMLSMVEHGDKESFPIYEAERIRAKIQESRQKRFAALVSGDAGFFSAAGKLRSALKEYSPRILPGISSLSYLSSRTGISWESAAIVSCHGRQGNAGDAVRRNRHTFLLCGGNVPEIAGDLCRAGFAEISIIVGEDLGSGDESISSRTAKELLKYQTASLTVLLIENQDADARVRAGIPDGEFLRGSLPMTKSLLRAAILSRLEIHPHHICYDIGAGTGSVSIEMALAAFKGKVFAIDKEEESAELVRENMRRFHVGNIVHIPALAPDLPKDLPTPDIAFIGGSGGKMKEIFSDLLKRNPKVRIAVTCIALESLSEAMQCFNEADIDYSVELLQVSRAKKTGRVQLMMAENPIYLLCGGKDE